MQKKSSGVVTKYSYLTFLNIILFLYIIFFSEKLTVWLYIHEDST